MHEVVLQASWAGRGSTEHLVDDRGELTLLFPVVGFPVASAHFFFFLVGLAGRVIRASRSYMTGSDSCNASLNDGLRQNIVNNVLNTSDGIQQAITPSFPIGVHVNWCARWRRVTQVQESDKGNHQETRMVVPTPSLHNAPPMR